MLLAKNIVFTFLFFLLMTCFNQAQTNTKCLTMEGGSSPTITAGTIRPIIIYCADTGQVSIIPSGLRYSNVQQLMSEYFSKATFGNLHVELTKVLTQGDDGIHAYISRVPYDWSAEVVQATLCQDILQQADDDYNFGSFDNNGPDGIPNSGDDDGIVDYVIFTFLNYSGYRGTVGLPINAIFTTNDLTPGGSFIKIDGSGYLSSNNKAITGRMDLRDMQHGVYDYLSGYFHEMGHSLFNFPDMDHNYFGYYNHYSLGGFEVMASIPGFNGIPSPYNPWFCEVEGWRTVTPITGDISPSINDYYSGTTNYGYKYTPTIPSYAWQNEKFYITLHKKGLLNRWTENWPVDYNLGGVLIWHVSENSINSNYINRRKEPIDIEAAHGKWIWQELSDRVQNTGIPDPLAGLDSLEIRKISGSEEIQGPYFNRDKGSNSVFFTPNSNKDFTFYTNPNSNFYNISSAQNYVQNVTSGFAVKNIRNFNGTNYLDIYTNNDTITSNATLVAGKWYITNNITIAAGVTLSINPGVNLIFNNNSSLIVSGTLIANGTPSSKITLNFVSPNSTTQNGIKVNSNASLTINHADIYSAYNGIAVNNGTISASDVTFTSCTNGLNFTGNVNIQSDLTVPSGVTLTIITNTTNPIAKLNLLNNSVLNVYGQLTSTTTWNPNNVIFDFQSPFISEQKINGIRLYPGSFFYVYAAHFKNAYCGIICKDCSPYQGNFLYTNCFFENMEVIGGSITSNYLQGHYLVEENLIVAGNDLTIDPPSYFLFLNGSSLISNGELYINGGEFDFFQPNEVTGNGIIGGANIDHAHILCAYNGIYPGAKLTNSTITGCNYGIIFNGFDVDYFYGNSIVNNNYGIYMVLAAAMMDQNSISYNYNTGLTSTIGSYPVLIDGGWNWGRNLIRGNNCGIKIRRHSSGLLGLECIPGQNWFDENSNLDIDIDETPIIAEGNYWRGINPYTSPYVSDLSGGSDFNNWLTDQNLRSVNNDELKIEKSVSNSGSENNSNSSQKSSSSYLNNVNNNSTSSSSLKDVFNLLKNKDYENVKKLSKEILNKDIDSNYALLALNLYKIASNKLNEKESLSNYLSELYNTKEKKPIYAVAGLMQSLNEKGDKKLSLIEDVITKYSGYDVVEMALFDKLLYYLFDKREREKAKEVLADLEKQFPEGDYTKDAKDFFVAFKPDRNLKSMPVTNSITKKVSEIEKPSEYKLIGNYPNPFNPSTTIKYALPKESNVELQIYDMMGREVRTLVSSSQVAGYKETVWDGRNSSGAQVSSGIYLYRIVAKSLEDGKTFEKSAKLIMMK